MPALLLAKPMSRWHELITCTVLTVFGAAAADARSRASRGTMICTREATISDPDGFDVCSQRRGRIKTATTKSKSRQRASDPIISRRSGERRYDSHSAKSTSLEAVSVSLGNR